MSPGGAKEASPPPPRLDVFPSSLCSKLLNRAEQLPRSMERLPTDEDLPEEVVGEEEEYITTLFSRFLPRSSISSISRSVL